MTQGDVSIVLEVVGEVHGGHAATAELTLEAVTICESGLKVGVEVGHGAGRRKLS